ncbi:MAG: LLM class flavin-dependent oxidoreductase [Opitutus sp.]|nr:LLM class flavin-dependent oxidoreductase [Opitutus sp.]
MNPATDPASRRWNRAYRGLFSPGRLTVGVFFPIEAFAGAFPTMRDQVRLARRAEELGFSALWFRDVPLLDPTFGDVGQVFDPWVYLAYIGAQTKRIALATGAIVLPLRHPLHTAKAAASVNELTGGRLVLGVASGDRPIEYPAFGVDFEERGARFRQSLDYIERALAETFPVIDSPLGRLDGADLVPKPAAGRIPVLVGGHSQQTIEWIAHHADGWLQYPRDVLTQQTRVHQWLTAVGAWKPFAQSLYIDLTDEPDAPARPIHLGFRLGRHRLIEHLRRLRAMGVNHVALNLKYGRRPAGDVLEELGATVLPQLAEELAAPNVGT